MASVLDTLGKAVRHNMLVRTECQVCGNVALYRASDLMMLYGGGRNPFELPFKCRKCKPGVKVSLVEFDHDRPPKMPVLRPVWRGQKIIGWMLGKAT